MVSGYRLTGLLGAASLFALASCDSGSPTATQDPPVEGSVVGSVKVEGTAIPNLRISLTGSVPQMATTDDGGVFRFDGLDEGSYTVAVAGLPDDAEFTASAGSVSISRERAFATLDFSGAWKRDVAIEVAVRVEGEGLQDATVTLQGSHLASGASLGPASGTTDATGTVTFEGLRRGMWEVVLGDYDAQLYDFPDPSLSVEVPGPPLREIGFDGTMIPQPPSAPVDLVAAASGSDAIGLTWTDMSEDEDRFDIERRPADGEWILLGTVADGVTAYNDGGLDPVATFAYRVRACNDAGCSEPSSEAEATTADVPPAQPTDFSVSATGPNSVRVTWTDVSQNEAHFDVERRAAAAGDGDPGASESWTATASTGADTTVFDDTGLDPATTYEYRIRACNDVGCSSFTAAASATTDDVPPSAPTDPAVVVTGSTTFRITWTDASDNEDSFEVERREAAAGPWTAVGSAAADETEWDDSGLSPTTLYGYRLRACNAVGCSEWTAEATGTTAEPRPLSPTSLSATADGETAIDLTWVDASANETGFLLQRSSNGTSWSALASLPAASSDFTDSGLSGGETWHYRVRACNAAGCSSWSNESSATTDTPPPPGPNLSIGGVYINQRIQRLDGDVPLVADIDGYLRVFVVASAANSLTPDVRVDFYSGGALTHSETISAPGGSVPQSVDEGSLNSSWNVLVPGSLIQPGLEIEVVVDPTDDISEPVESDNSYPSDGGVESLDVRDTPTFEVTFVPVRQTVNGRVGNVNAGNAANFLEEAKAMLPFADFDAEIRSEYSTDLPAVTNSSSTWGPVLSEIHALRSLDGSSRYYYGVVNVAYGSGIAGLGYIGWPMSIGWDKSRSAGGVAAHEWGHNLGRGHSPGCGAGGADGSYPHAGGRIGHWGLHVPTLDVKSPATHHDFMGYCGPDWISDYVFEEIIDEVAPAPSGGAPSLPPGRSPAGAAAEPGLLVWGRIEGGNLIIEPALEVHAPASLPSGGAYTIRGQRADGSALFSYNFDPIAVADGDGDEAHFAFVIPLRTFSLTALADIRLTSPRVPAMAIRSASVGPVRAPGAAPAAVSRIGATDAEVVWNPAEYPMVVVRDAESGQVLSLGRSGRVRVTPESDRVQLEFSNGLGSVETLVRTWR